MSKPMITVSSITYAMKAKEILRRNGISAYVIKRAKNSRNASCSYAVQVPKKIDEAYRILSDSGMVKLTGIYYEGDA